MSESITLLGSTSSTAADEVVLIEGRSCGESGFHPITSARTRADGRWQASLWVTGTTTLRAVWRGKSSAGVVILSRPLLVLTQLTATLFKARVTSKRTMRGKPVLFQRLERRLGRWTTVKRALLVESEGGSFGGAAASALFTAKLPKGTAVRLVLPLSAARPCHIAGVSPIQTVA